MEGINRILSPLSADWYAWTILFLAICAILSELFQPGVLTRAISMLQFRSIKRMYKEAPTNFLGQLFITLFRIGVPGLIVMIFFSVENQFSFLSYLLVCGLMLGVIMVKMLLNQWIDYTFMLSHHYEELYEQYGHMVTLLAIAYYPFLLVLMYLYNSVAAGWVLIGGMVLFWLLFLYRSVRIFYRTPASILYILIYFLTMELLPVGALWGLTSQLIKVI